LLVVHVGLDGLQSSASAGDDEETGGPERLSPEFAQNLGQLVLADEARGGAFQPPDDLTEGEVRWILDHQVNVVAIAFEGEDLDAEGRGCLAHGLPKEIEDASAQHVSAVLRAEDKVGVKQRDGVALAAV